MKAGWILCSLVVLLAAQSSLADEIGEISDDPPPLMDKNIVGGEGGVGKSTTKEGVNVKEKPEEEKKKEGDATGSVEKGEKSRGRVDGKKPVSPLSESGEKEKETTKAAKSTGLSGEIREKEMAKAGKGIDLSGSGEKRLKEKKKAEKEKALDTNETTTAEKNSSLPTSAEQSVKESRNGEKIVMMSSSGSSKKNEEEKNEGESKSIVAPLSEKNVKSTETANKLKPTSAEKKASGEKKEENELKDVKKPVVDQSTTQQQTTTVVTTVNLPLTEDSEEKTGMVDGEGEGTSDEQEEPEGDQVKGEEKTEKKEEKKKEEKSEEKRPYPIPIKEEYYSDSHFFSFFIFFLVLSAVGYLAYHNKRKIMALMIEGRSGKGGRVKYHRLANDDNFERNVIY